MKRLESNIESSERPVLSDDAFGIWRHVESAPTDGTRLLGYYNWSYHPTVHVIAFKDGAWRSKEFTGGCCPDYWMALPLEPRLLNTEATKITIMIEQNKSEILVASVTNCSAFEEWWAEFGLKADPPVLEMAYKEIAFKGWAAHHRRSEYQQS